MADGVDLSLSGLASGFDWKSLVSQLMQAERSPETQWRAQQSQIQQRNYTFGQVASLLGTLQSSAQALKDTTLYDSRSAQVSDATVASASAGTGTAPGIYTFNITKLATAATLAGTSNVGKPLSSSSDVSGVSLTSGGFLTAITAGTFTVNGQQVTIATTDTLKDVFAKIATATSNQVTASYIPSSDKIELVTSDKSTLVLGSSTDTSNFLQVARLASNGTNDVTSSLALGGIRQDSTLSSAGFTTALSDGGSGAGKFRINGVDINFNANQDTVSTLLNRINTSKAGVTASYDAINDRFQLTSKTTGDIGIALEDISGNFLQAAGLSAPHMGSPLSNSSDVSGLTLATAGFATPVTAGTFTVNGQQVTIATTDALKDVFDKIATATGNQVTASYNPSSDKIILSSSSAITLGSSSDTSNFLQAAHLPSDGTGASTTVISNSILGNSVQLGAQLSTAGFAQTISDGGSGAGQFKINGVTISFSASQDTVQNVLDRINASSAGVTAAYDSIHDRIQLTSQAGGSTGVTLEDVTGNFVAATGLASLFNHGQNLVYTLNGSTQLTSQTNTITASSSGIAGLSVTALKENASVSVTVTNDTSKVKSAIQSFVDAYNKVQSYLDTQSASSTDSQGKVTAGILAGDSTASDISASLRSTAFASISGASGILQRLADLGYETSGYNNSLTLSDSDQLDQTLANNLPDLKQFFSDTTNGLAVKFDSVLTKIIGDNGSLSAHQTALTKQSSAIDDQIAALEKSIQADQTRMTNEFIAMETAQANINQQLQYLTRSFPS